MKSCIKSDIGDNRAIMVKFYSVKHKNNLIQTSSSSGGAFTAISDVILARGGLIIGGGYSYDQNIVEPRICKTPEDRDQLRGSKYLQCDLKNIFRQIKTELERVDENPILFVGTPCQVDGLKHYCTSLHLNTSRLYLCDIVCHGVPSPGLWKNYIEQLIRTGSLENVTFKDKRIGWKQPLAFATINGKEKSLRNYTLLYFGELISRPCCSKCPYSSVNRISDITIGDHWGIEGFDPEFYSKGGVSLVITNSDKGTRLFEELQDSVEIKERSVEQCLQPNLQKPSVAHKNRTHFWTLYHKDKQRAIREYGIRVAFEKVKRRLVRR